MIWAVLVVLGVPLWLCAIAVSVLVTRNRHLRRRPGDMPVRLLRPGKTRWVRGHAVWVSDVLAFRGSPAAWTEDLVQVAGVTIRAARPEDRKALHRLGNDPVIASLTTAAGGTPLLAVAPEHRATLAGPFT